MWISKDGDIRKQELLDTALLLFEQGGYENTSINDIIQKVGVTKGAFYYYFNSKEDILNILSEQQADLLIDVAKKYASDTQMNALEKLNAIAAKAIEAKMTNMKQRLIAYNALQNEKGLLLGIKVLEKTIAKGRPLIESIIVQGLREGRFDTQFPEECAETYIMLSSLVSGTITQILSSYGKKAESVEMIRNKLQFYEDLFTRLLGIRNGSVSLTEACLRNL
jgi:AcrR family transcriptional regulator